ncbi:MAG TPA: response regulator [Acidisarcina sp.]|nr:response regulator [Acidisarcina sp.]
MTRQSQTDKAHSILVVDDDPISRELVALLLGSEGHSVTQAATGNEALEALAHADARERPSAILVDLNMPGLCGEELARQLRRHAGSDVRILAMSASEPATTAPFDGFLLKPIDTAALARLLAEDDAGPATPSGPPVAEDSPVLNQAIFARLQGMMPKALMREVFETCIEDVHQRIPKMTECLEQGDLKGLRQAAHAIKGGASMIGAARLSQIAGKIEAGSYQPDEGQRFLKELSSACDELRRILLERNAGKLW